ncbi:unnamed protein product, partial [Amoebophrya sp. A120]
YQPLLEEQEDVEMVTLFNDETTSAGKNSTTPESSNFLLPKAVTSESENLKAL